MNHTGQPTHELAGEDFGPALDLAGQTSCGYVKALASPPQQPLRGRPTYPRLDRVSNLQVSGNSTRVGDNGRT